MRERAPVWLARLTLATLLAIPLWFLLDVPIHHSNHFWPYGHVHSVGQGILVVLSYIVVFPIGGGIGLMVIGLIAIEICLSTACLWKTAWRKRHIPWRKRWGALAEDGYKGEWVRYNKPPPLIRGRLGSK